MFNTETDDQIPNSLKRMANPQAFNQKSFPASIKADANSAWNLDTTIKSNFVNPVISYLNSIESTLASIDSTCNTITGLGSIQSAVTDPDLLTEIIEIGFHTDRLSGQLQPGEESVERKVPYLIIVSTIGKTLAYMDYVLTNQVTGDTRIANNYSAIVAESEFSANDAYFTAMAEHISTDYTETGIDPVVLETNLTPTEITTYVNYINGYKNFILALRTNDEATFANSLTELDNVSTTFSTTIIETQVSIIDNSISNSSVTIT